MKEILSRDEAAERLAALAEANTTYGEGELSLDLTRATEDWDLVVRSLGRKETYRRLAELVCAGYRAERGEDFPFTEACVAFELGYHIDAYLWSQGFKGSHRHVTTMLFTRQALDRHCRSVDISVKDLNNLRQRTMFRYKKGLRKPGGPKEEI